MAFVDCTPFYHAVIEHLLAKPNTQDFIAQLGLNLAIKQSFADLNLSKAKKMGCILDLRPDLFSRTIGHKGGAMVQLEALAHECRPPNFIPPLSGALASKVVQKPPSFPVSPVANTLVAAGVTLDPPPYNVSSPTEARKYFLKGVLLVLAVQPDGFLATSQLGQIEQIQQSWKAGNLNTKYKMIEILKERPDIIRISRDATQTNAIVSLTEIGLACARNNFVPDPDHTCPPPSTPKSAMYGPGGVRIDRPEDRAAGYGRSDNQVGLYRSDPYGSGSGYSSYGAPPAPVRSHSSHTGIGLSAPKAAGVVKGGVQIPAPASASGAVGPTMLAGKGFSAAATTQYQAAAAAQNIYLQALGYGR